MANESQAEIDLHLVRKVQAGEKQAFDLLVKKYQHKIIALVGRYVYDNHEAQDVTQEAFIKAYRALAGFRGDSAFYTWLYRVAINTAKNHLVSRGRRAPTLDIDADDAQYFESAEGLHDIASPEAELAKNQLSALVRKTMDKLPEELRVALSLREFDGMSYEDISQVMGCPVGTVRSRIFRAREAIDKEIQPLLAVN